MTRLRDVVEGTIDAALVERRVAEGWKPVAIEWVRANEADRDSGGLLPAPYGFEVAEDGRHLEENVAEMEVLRHIMKGVVNDRPLTAIAGELNGRGFRTREGEEWNPARVFRLMPALIDNGPRIFATPEWPSMRQA
jgi:hypothetical protein